MNLEILKPVETGAGRMQPFLRIAPTGNSIQFNKTARSLLDIEGGGAIQFARETDSGSYYIIVAPDKRATNLYHVSKAGKLSDLLLPAKLAAHAGDKKRLYINSVPITHDGRKAFLILKKK